MNDRVSENRLLELLQQSEDYEDALDLLHPEDKIREDLTKTRSLRITRGGASSKMALVVGHTRRSPGAMGASPISTHEYAWNNQLARHIKSVANFNHVECGIFYRDGIGIQGAYQKVRQWAPNSCIELHFNAFNSQVGGTETLFGLYEPSREWAEILQQSMVSLYEREGRMDRGIKQRLVGERGGKSVNQLEAIPSCLIEPYFGDMSRDAELADIYLLDLAEVIVDAHRRMFS